MAFLGVRTGLSQFLRPGRESDFQELPGCDVSETLTHRAQKKIIGKENQRRHGVLHRDF
jgi:hypothetical protein